MKKIPITAEDRVKLSAASAAVQKAMDVASDENLTYYALNRKLFVEFPAFTQNGKHVVPQLSTADGVHWTPEVEINHYMKAWDGTDSFTLAELSHEIGTMGRILQLPINAIHQMHQFILQIA